MAPPRRRWAGAGVPAGRPPPPLPPPPPPPSSMSITDTASAAARRRTRRTSLGAGRGVGAGSLPVGTARGGGRRAAAVGGGKGGDKRLDARQLTHGPVANEVEEPADARCVDGDAARVGAAAGAGAGAVVWGLDGGGWRGGGPEEGGVNGAEGAAKALRGRPGQRVIGVDGLHGGRPVTTSGGGRGAPRGRGRRRRAAAHTRHAVVARLGGRFGSAAARFAADAPVGRPVRVGRVALCRLHAVGGYPRRRLRRHGDDEALHRRRQARLGHPDRRTGRSLSRPPPSTGRAPRRPPLPAAPRR